MHVNELQQAAIEIFSFTADGSLRVEASCVHAALAIAALLL